VAFGTPASLASSNSIAASTSIAHSPLVAVAAGDYVLAVVAKDNTTTTTGQTADITSFVDDGGNTWDLVYEYTYSPGAAGTGVTVSLWLSKLTTAMATTDAMTAAFASTVAKVLGGASFSVGSGNTVQVAGTPQVVTGSGSAPTSTISGLPNKEYLFFVAVGLETRAAVGSLGVDYSALFNGVADNGSNNASIRARLFSRILTGTGDTATGASMGADKVWIHFALEEVSGAPTLTVADCTHGQAAEAPALTQANTLAIQDALHAHAAESPTLQLDGATLTVADAAHEHAAESPALTQQNTLAAQDALHSHAAESPALVQQNVLAAQDAAHAHTADSPALTQQNVLAADDALHGHVAESPTLEMPGALVVQDALHAHLADNLTLTQASQLAVQEALHAHTADSPLLSIQFLLAVQDALHAHFAENPALAQASLLIVQDALHAHTAGSSAIFLPDEPATIYRGGRVIRGAGSARVVNTLPTSPPARVIQPTISAGVKH
jgi:hypothetical protein